MGLLNYLRSRKKANLLLVIINIAIFLWMLISGGNTESASYMLEHGAMYAPAVLEDHEYYRLFTSMFLHFGMTHLFYNMLLLFFAGDMLEEKVGAVRYLCIYLLGGLAGNLLSFGVHVRMDDDVISAGASGAIFAVIGGLVYLVVKNRGHLENIDARGVCIMAALSLVQGFTESGIDNFGHLGGFLGGFLAAAVLRTGIRSK